MARRTLVDRLRLEYRRTTVTPTGQSLVVRARRRVESVELLSWPLPVAVVVVWAAIRELRFRRTRNRRPWIVEVYPRFEPEKAHLIAEATKFEAFDRVDRVAEDRGTTGDWT